MSNYRMLEVKIVVEPGGKNPVDMGSFTVLLPREENNRVSLKGDLKVAKYDRNTTTGKIFNITNKKELKGNFCLYSEKEESDVNRIVKLAFTQAKASACIVAVAPTEPIEIPVIVLGKEMSCEPFEMSEGLDLLIETIVEDTAETTASDVDSEGSQTAMGANHDEKAPVDNGTTVSESRGNERKQKSSWAETIGSVPVVGEVFRTVAKAFTRSVVKNQFEGLLSSGIDWLGEREYDKYAAALSIVAIACDRPEDEAFFELSTLCNSVEKTLKDRKFKVDVLFLSFAIWLLRESNGKAHGNDRSWAIQYEYCLIQCIDAYDPLVHQGLRLCEMPLVGPHHPRVTLNTFISHVVASWFSRTREMKVPDVTLRNILWLWSFHCDQNDDGWMKLRKQAAPNFFENQRRVLETFLDPKLFQSLGLSLCITLKSFRRLCLELWSEKQGSLLLANTLSDHLIELVQRCYRLGSTSREQVPKDLVDVLRHIHFDGDDRTSRHRVIRALVSQLSFRIQGKFDELNELFETVGIGNRDHDLFRESIYESVLTDIGELNCSGEGGVRMVDTRSLLQLKIGKALAGPSGIEVFSDYMMRCMGTKAIMKTKVKFLGVVYEYFIAGQWAPSRESFLEHIRECLSRAINYRPRYCRRGPLDSVFDTFAVAVDLPDIFYAPEADDKLYDWLAQEVVSLLEPSELERSSDGFVAAFDKFSRTGPLLSALIEYSKGKLSGGCFKLKRAVNFHRALCERNANVSKHILDISRYVFFRAFEKWNPTVIEDIISLGSFCLRDTYDCLVKFVGSVGDADAQACIEKMKIIIVMWKETFQGKEITLSTVSSLIEHFDVKTWDTMRKFSEVDLPDLEALENTSQEFARLKRSILSHSCVANMDDSSVIKSQSIITIIREYRAVPEVDSPFHRILSDYESLLDEKSRNVTITSIDEAISLKSMLDDDEYLATLRNSHDTKFRLAEHFLRSRSIIFRDVIGFGSWDELPMEELFEKIVIAKSSLEALFADSSTLGDVKKAASIVSMANGTLEEELVVLCDCPLLQTTKKGMELILTIALLIDSSQPLAQFVRSCHQFKFGFVENDPIFDQVVALCGELTSDEAPGYSLARALTIASKIVDLFVFSSDSPRGPNDAPASPVAVATHLRRMFPTLVNFAELSLCSDVWTLVREMQWFGSDGLKRFYEEHDNVTNVLLSDSASFEMSVLNSLELTVRHLSVVGGLQNSSSFREFFRSCHTNEDLLEDIRIVQQNVSSVREWFTNGMDDLAAIFSTFEQICNTGEYVIRPPGDKSSPTALDCLRLCYQRKGSSNDLTIDNYSLQGQKLTDFIQQLGFIQHEKNEVAEKVKIFVDKHRIIAKAVSKNLYMFDLGFGGVDIATFSFDIAQTNLSDAKRMLNDSDQMRAHCDVWLAQILDDNPLSRLFWMDELKSMSKLLRRLWEHSYGDWGAGILDSIILIASRIIPPQSKISLLGMQGTASAVIVRIGPEVMMDQSWILDATTFLAEWHKALEIPTTSLDQVEDGTKIVVHNIERCDEVMKNDATMIILQSIYKGRLPACFEVFDAIVQSPLHALVAFLDRALAFPTSCFTILNADALSGEQQEKILSFLSRRDIASKGIKFHCIQHAGIILRTSPWVEDRSWDSTLLGSLQGNLPQLQNITIYVVSTPSPGTGKTRYIRQELKSASENGSEVCSINIHEGASLDALIGALSRSFTSTANNKAVYFSISHIPSHSSARSPWLAMVNHFFFSFLVLGLIRDPHTGVSFHLGQGSWTVFVELPASDSVNDHSVPLDAEVWLQKYVPVLVHYGTIIAPPEELQIDTETRRVCTYLRAYDNGTINRRFQSGRSKRVIFLLDESGSMEYEIDEGKNALDVATDNALQIFDSHVQIEDRVGLLTFDHRRRNHVWPSQEVTDATHKQRLRRQMDGARQGAWGGTRMYRVLEIVLDDIEAEQFDGDTWIVCLTDGHSQDSKESIEDRLRRSPNSLNIIVVGVNLDSNLQEEMRNLCNKYGAADRRDNRGFFIATEAQTDAMNDAFGQVARSIPVSQTFELDGDLRDEDCRELLRRYLPDFVVDEDKLVTTFWIRYLYRRVSVLDANESFNYNETHDTLGSSLLETMLAEVETFLKRDHRNYNQEDYRQLIYDFTHQDNPEFRLLCTCPELLADNVRAMYEGLELPGFSIPSSQALQQRSTLDTYLSQALQIPLDEGPDGNVMLSCIDNSGFVLTLDFTVKLLNMHERISCRIPCILEGETGVSKTALTKMYSILMNSAIRATASEITSRKLGQMEAQLEGMGISLEAHAHEENSLKRLELAIIEASEGTISDETQVAQEIYKMLQCACASRKSIFRSPPHEYTGESTDTKEVLAFLRWFASSELEPTFFEINVHSSLSEVEVIERFAEIRAIARKLIDSESVVVVFLDEVNTASNLGLFKEIIIDRSICGEELELNIVIVSACNPPRTQAARGGLIQRENDLGKDWASGHYQVSKLPESMEKLKWAYGSLNSVQEKDFVFRRLELLGRTGGIEGAEIPSSLAGVLTELITTSQEGVRAFARESIRRRLERMAPEDATLCEANDRARSVVSLRDIQRVFNLYKFFYEDFSFRSMDEGISGTQRCRQAMLLSIAVVYYLRLDEVNRAKLLEMLQGLPTEAQQPGGRLLDVLNAAMDKVLENTEIPPGIALTRGVKENVFMTLVCSLSRTPLMIVGPPGSSKTLSVNVVSDNANGEESPSPFYRNQPRISTFHYQCSKASTSNEVGSVFEKAIQRQRKVDSSAHKCLVFMDEAGLPEEERESLKVLHYFLEGHMSTKAEVSFVAITNHVLDAAKSNRCVSLLRQEPDEDELRSIAVGILFDANADGEHSTRLINCDSLTLNPGRFASSLCKSYTYLMHNMDEFMWFELFFGLRDFVFLLKAIRSRANIKDMVMELSVHDLVQSFEQNFSGTCQERKEKLVMYFLVPLLGFTEESDASALIKLLCTPMEVVRIALSRVEIESNRQSRYKLIIDESDDDSMLRLLQIDGVLELGKRALFKLSRMPEDADLEKSRLVSGVKYCALQGNAAVLSQTESVNESFYDLFNQNFRSLKSHTGETSLFANIAVGGVSRRSLVRPSFQCIVHTRMSELDEVPAPFLNRFEKFRLGVGDVLASGWQSVGDGMEAIFRRSHKRVLDLKECIGADNMFGFIEHQTIDSIFVDILPKPQSKQHCTGGETSITDHFVSFINAYSSLDVNGSDVKRIIETAMKVMPLQDSDLLSDLLTCNHLDNNMLEGAFHVLLEGAFQSVLEGKVTTSIGQIAAVIVEMLVTREASFRLLLLSTPEAVFARRHILPPEAIHEYFRQHHFSLKSMVKSRPSPSGLLVVHTRTDASIRSVPTLSSESERIQQIPSEQMALVTEFVHDDPDKVLIEHLLLLRSEIAIRTTIESWASKTEKRILLFLVDMNDFDAIDRVNFVRTMVEQHIPLEEGKSVVILLHYTQSGSHLNSHYPALFLGGWKHLFLDGIGSASIKPEKWIEAACFNTLETTSSLAIGINESISLLMPKALTYVACQAIFHQDQGGTLGGCERGSFLERYNALSSLMKRRVGSATVEELLRDKFATLWSNSNLVKMLKKSSESLIDGTSQLSMSLSLRSTFQETLGLFLASLLADMNQWRNLDVLNDDCRNNSTDELFGFILSILPVMPFEELVLQRQVPKKGNQVGLHVMPLIRFPFFYFVSSFLDLIVERAECLSDGNILELDTSGSNPSASKTTFVLMERALDILRDSSDDSDTYRSDLTVESIQEIVARVKDESPSQSDSLFRRYLQQFLAWKLSCEPSDLVVTWMLDKLSSEFGNILAIHVVARIHEVPLMRMASWSIGAKKGCGSDTRQELVGIDASGPNLQVLQRKIVQDFVERDGFGEMHSLTVLLKELQSMVPSGEISDDHLACELRLLSFLYILNASEAPGDIKRNTRRRWYDSEETMLCTPEDIPGLNSFVSAFQEYDICNEEWYADMIETLFQHFFSPLWLGMVKQNQEDDLRFLIHIIAENKVMQRHQLAVVLLRRGLQESNGSGHTTLGLSTTSLEWLGSKITCDNLYVFSEESEQRVSVPHYIPSWLLGGTPSIDVNEQTANNGPLRTFFNDYSHSFKCHLTDVVFDVITGEVIDQAEDSSAEQLLITLLQDLTVECSLKRSEVVRSQRLRAYSEEGTGSLAGTAVGSLIVDARLLAYVTKVAYELATTSSCAALTGPYSKLACDVLEATMSQGGCLWQEFLFHTITRLRGEGNLLVLLGSGGLFHDFDWCRPWIEGLPSNVSGKERELKDAEDALAEAQQDENRKARELRLCPHCARLFTVLERNCGQFICGRDAHGDIGNDRIYGCGRGFAINASRPYLPDERILAPLRRNLADKQRELEVSNASALRFHRVREMDVPVMLFKLQDRGESLAPVCNLLDEFEATSDPDLNAWAKLFRIVAKDRTNFPKYVLLPDLIEIYMWIHSTFRFLVTKTQALDMKMGHLMNQNILRRRFDPVNTNHILALWGRVTDGLNSLLNDAGYEIFWDCERVQIPFRKLEDASLMMMLSELGHPTEGNDFLFLCIHSIVQEYNSFAQRFNECLLPKRDSVETEPRKNAGQIHPKFLVRGGKVLSMSSNFLQDFAEDAGRIESFWRSDIGYDSDKLRGALKDGQFSSTSQALPIILSTTTFLRERFHFRDDAVSSNHLDKPELATRSGDGMFFVHMQDLTLYESTKQSLGNFWPGCGENDEALAHTFRISFHDSDYDFLRSMLEGIRAATSPADAKATQTDDKATFGEIIRRAGVSHGDIVLSHDMLLRRMGFPVMKETQWQLLKDMSFGGILQLTKWLGYQLASEGYLFSTLPLRMTERLSDTLGGELETLLTRLYRREGIAATLELLNEFVTSCVSFYEKQICETALDSRPLLMFLQENNYGDKSSFPFFEVIPDSVTIRQYVSLRQFLHQAKLHLIAMLSSQDEGESDNADDMSHRSLNLSKIQRGFCWLWSGGHTSEMVSEDLESESEQVAQGMKQIQRLWFDVVPKKKTFAEDKKDLKVNCDSRCVSEHEAACRIQKLWRNKRKRNIPIDAVERRKVRVTSGSVQEEKIEATPHSRNEPSAVESSSGKKMQVVRPWPKIILSLISFSLCCVLLGWLFQPSAPFSQRLNIYSNESGLSQIDGWLQKHNLHHSLKKQLARLGARSVDDILLIMNEHPEMLGDISPLDKKKLALAVQTEMNNSADETSAEL